MIHKITPKISGWNVWTLNLMKQPIKINLSLKLLGQRISKRCYKTLGTIVINSQLPFSLPDFSLIIDFYFNPQLYTKYLSPPSPSLKRQTSIDLEGGLIHKMP